LGYNDLNILRNSLSDIEKTKLNIDEEIVTLQHDVATLVEIRDERLPYLKELNSDLSKFLPEEKEKLARKQQEFDHIQKESEDYDNSKNIFQIRNQIQENDELKSELKLAAEEASNAEIFLMLLFGVLSGYISYKIVEESFWVITVVVVILASMVGAGAALDIANHRPNKTLSRLFDEKKEYSAQYSEVLTQSVNMSEKCKSLESEISKLARDISLIEYRLDLINGRETTKPHHVKTQNDETLFLENRWQRQHNKPWLCPICTKRFITSMAVHSHMKDKRHPGEPIGIMVAEQQYPDDTKVSDLNKFLEDILDLESDETMPLLEGKVQDYVLSISEKVDDVRNKSTKISELFNQIKHLIPNSDSISPTSTDLEEILTEITNQVGLSNT